MPKVMIPPLSPPVRSASRWSRHLPISTGFVWLAAGWADFWRRPVLSLAYGLAVFAASIGAVVGMFRLELDYVLLPALSAFLILGPLVALGLYEKSRRLSEGRAVTLRCMMFVVPRSGGQVIFAGLMLALLVLLWMRAAVILYALFFGLLPFPGLAGVGYELLHTSAGWGLLLVGTLVGGLFAAFAFAISVFSIPMLLNERSDALTAMGTSMVLVTNNLPVMLVWGATVLVLMVISILSGFLGLIVFFPVVGHATWHSYRTMRQDPAADRAIAALDGAPENHSNRQ